MPEELSRLIQDFARPNPNKKKWDAVTKQMRKFGEWNRYNPKCPTTWGLWVNTMTDDEWDLMVSNSVAPASLIEAEGEWINSEFLGLSLAQNMLDSIDVANEDGF